VLKGRDLGRGRRRQTERRQRQWKQLIHRNSPFEVYAARNASATLGQKQA
jgi:hypothetical protein